MKLSNARVMATRTDDDVSWWSAVCTWVNVATHTFIWKIGVIGSVWLALILAITIAATPAIKTWVDYRQSSVEASSLKTLTEISKITTSFKGPKMCKTTITDKSNPVREIKTEMTWEDDPRFTGALH